MPESALETDGGNLLLTRLHQITSYLMTLECSFGSHVSTPSEPLLVRHKIQAHRLKWPTHTIEWQRDYEFMYVPWSASFDHIVRSKLMLFRAISCQVNTFSLLLLSVGSCHPFQRAEKRARHRCLSRTYSFDCMSFIFGWKCHAVAEQFDTAGSDVGTRAIATTGRHLVEFYI